MVRPTAVPAGTCCHDDPSRRRQCMPHPASKAARLHNRLHALRHRRCTASVASHRSARAAVQLLRSRWSSSAGGHRAASPMMQLPLRPAHATIASNRAVAVRLLAKAAVPTSRRLPHPKIAFHRPVPARSVRHHAKAAAPVGRQQPRAESPPQTRSPTPVAAATMPRRWAGAQGGGGPSGGRQHCGGRHSASNLEDDARSRHVAPLLHALSCGRDRKLRIGTTRHN